MAGVAFWVLAVLAVTSAIAVISVRNLVLGALALAFHLVSIAGLFLLLDAQFIAFLQVIVYAGAIMVLILFVIMLLNLQEWRRQHESGPVQRWLSALLTAAFAAVLVPVLWREGAGAGFAAPSAGFGTVSALGRELFTRFFYPFEVISLLLVVAMVGAVLLAKRRL